jgi:hypothetical protein
VLTSDEWWVVFAGGDLPGNISGTIDRVTGNVEFDYFHKDYRLQCKPTERMF